MDSKKWKKSFFASCKYAAQHNVVNTAAFNYGTQIYATPKIIATTDFGDITISWVVMEFEGEFNVFLDKSLTGIVDLLYLTSFNQKEPAINYALRLLYTCAGIANQ